MSSLSLGGRALPVALGVIGLKRRMQDPAALGREMSRARTRPRSPAPPWGLVRGVDIAAGVSEAGWRVYTVRPRRPSAAASTGWRQRAVYLHGGSYIHEITRFHWMLIANLARTTGTEISVPIYPLAPMGTASSVVPAATDLVKAILQVTGPKNTVLLGDSAGGGMALAVVVSLRDGGSVVPRDTVLITPWLDIALTDPAIARIAPRDPMPSVAGLHMAGVAYRRELEETDPRVSPVMADLNGLGRLTVFAGTRDILQPDALRLREGVAAGTSGTQLELHELAGGIHVYPLLPIPEGKAARRIIRATITRH